MRVARRSPLWAGLGRPILPAAPFNQLPAFLSGQDAGWCRSPVRNPTDPIAGGAARSARRAGAADGSQLDADGLAIGTGRERAPGIRGGLAQGRSRALTRQRKQAVESMLGRGLRGVTLESLSTNTRRTWRSGHAGLGLRVSSRGATAHSSSSPPHWFPRGSPALLETAERQSRCWSISRK